CESAKTQARVVFPLSRQRSNACCGINDHTRSKNNAFRGKQCHLASDAPSLPPKFRQEFGTCCGINELATQSRKSDIVWLLREVSQQKNSPSQRVDA
ncbi:MAG: hypothetical protein GY820_01985, partial [Gammaproteobacteria bacterium]|nr:hypothetical protein [Gammaproteobacteria bacterium]